LAHFQLFNPPSNRRDLCADKLVRVKREQDTVSGCLLGLE
jgi:hypothetical protein